MIKLAKTLMILVVLFNTGEILSQENIRPFRIGGKLGYPNIVGGNVEYVLPFLNKKFAITADYSRINSANILETAGFEETGEEDAQFTFRNFGGGLNYYFLKSGKTLYIGANYNYLNLEGYIIGVESETIENKEGNGFLDFNNNSFNLKLGAKLGGLFYFRPEVGYSFNPFPKNIPLEVEFEDGSSEIQTYNTNVFGPIHNGLIANIGIGFAF